MNMFPTALLLCMFRSCGFSKKRLLSTITNCFIHGLLAFPIAGCFWVTPLFFSSRSLGPVPWLFFLNRVTPLFFSSRFLGPVPWLFLFFYHNRNTQQSGGIMAGKQLRVPCLCMSVFQCLCWFQFSHVFPFENKNP